MAKYDLKKDDIEEVPLKKGDVVSNILKGLSVSIDSEKLGDGAYGTGTYQVRVIKSTNKHFIVGSVLIWDTGLLGKESLEGL